jgi:aminomethyltransferase
MFDVSHMGEFILTGKDAGSFLNYMTTNDVSTMNSGDAQYSAMCYENGGLVDDLVLYRFSDHFMMVVNAANIEKDWDWMNQNITGDVVLNNISDELGLLAVQGPCSLEVLQKIAEYDLSKIPFYHFVEEKIAGIDVVVSRTGYTGELGFELYHSPLDSEDLWYSIFDAGEEYQIQPIGLAARDTLRLEMKYCLYGNDIDETTNPIEAGLGWITKINKGDFIGRSAILHVKENGLSRKLVGFVMKDRAIPRPGYAIINGKSQIGYVTSGNHSPMLNMGIGMGYVSHKYSELGTEISIDVRGKIVPAQIVRTPFLEIKNKPC